MLHRCLSILKLALPVMVSQIGLILVAFADNIMVGRYSTQALASSSFVVNVFNIVIIGGLGFSYGLTPIVGALFAGRKQGDIGRIVRVGLRANIAVGILMSLVMGTLYFFLDRMGQPDELLPIIRPYYLITLAGLIPLAVFNVFAQWSYGIRNTAMPMWILLSANAVNIIGNYMLIYGNWGAPEMGLTGAGISTLTARIIAMVAIVAIFLIKRSNRTYRTGFSGRDTSDGQRMAKVVRTSWPVALQMMFETGAFSLCAILAGWLGTVPLAAFQVIIIVGTLGFCIYYSIGTAITVQVSNDAGAKSLAACRRSAFDGYAVMLFFAAISSSIFILFGRQLMGLFSQDEAVLAVAGSVIFPLVLYQIGDATQITFANALRGTANVMPMLWIAFVSYVVVGLPSSYILALPAGLGVYGILLSFSLSLFLAAALFMRAFIKTTGSKHLITLKTT